MVTHTHTHQKTAITLPPTLGLIIQSIDTDTNKQARQCCYYITHASCCTSDETERHGLKKRYYCINNNDDAEKRLECNACRDCVCIK